MDFYDRTRLLIGEEKLNVLKNSSVAVFGIGGVGGFCAEALVRSGIGKIALFDSDSVSESNLNRQIISTCFNIGKDKVDVFSDRAKSINPDIQIEKYKVFYLPENAGEFDLTKYNYVIDAIDTVSAKITLIENCKKNGVPVISCMGTGGKLNPERLKVSDIKETSVCPLARVMRRELKKRGIENLKVVYSDEQPSGDNGRDIPSMIFVPATAGMIIAKEVIKDLIFGEEK